MLKQCEKCKKMYHGSTRFLYIGKASGGKKYYVCRECNTKRKARYRKTENGRRTENEAVRRARKKHKVKWLARAKARYAVKKGTLIKPKNCEVCTLVRPLQGHHEDYSKPLEVIWLCTGCHADADRELEMKSTPNNHH